ncbi:MAG TPA: hypothetical protein VL486_14650 [Verrucomicrobiae bacterium]|nr:hypothetical protein [Verrucomicrobiae bacterium]
MKIQELHVGMTVKHPHHGLGTVKAITETSADVRFNDATRTIVPETSDLTVAEVHAAISGLDVPLAQFIEKTVRTVLAELGVEQPGAVVEQLGGRWQGGRMVLHPADASLQAKEVPLDVFFHKIVMVRNNLRVLEQKINSHDKLSDAERVEFQQYVTRSYGSLTTFNILFRNKEDQFKSGE